MTDFKNNPAVLGDMRMCLKFMADLKGVKLEHLPGDYDMETMLDMMKEMESMPIKRSFECRCSDFWLDARIWCARIALIILAKLGGPEVKRKVAELLAEEEKKEKQHVSTE